MFIYTICIYIYTCIHANIYICVYIIYTHNIYIFIYICIYMCVCMCFCVVSVCVCERVRVSECVCVVFVCVRACVRVCVRVCFVRAELHCGSLEAPSHGSKQGSNVTVDSVVTFTCDGGYRLEGTLKRKCADHGTWDGVEAKCVGQSQILRMIDNVIAGARI